MRARRAADSLAPLAIFVTVRHAPATGAFPATPEMKEDEEEEWFHQSYSIAEPKVFMPIAAQGPLSLGMVHSQPPPPHLGGYPLYSPPKKEE